MTLIVHETDTATLDLIEYYKKRIESTESEYQQALDSIDAIKICTYLVVFINNNTLLAHSETHKLAWEVLKRTKEVNQLQQALGDFQAAVFEERKKTLSIVAENDALKSRFQLFSNYIRYLE